MVADGFLAKAAFGHEPTRTCFADDAILAAMIRVEAALALAQADLGMIPPSAAAAIAALGDGAAISIDVLSDGVRDAGVPVPALLGALRSKLDPADADWLHYGATSQDIVDTAFCLCFREGLDGLEDALGALIDALQVKSREFDTTPMLARTRGQLATPITAGLRVAEWAQPLITLEAELAGVRNAALRVQFGGASGSRNIVAPHGAAIAEAMAKALGLSDSPPWHTDRSGFLRLADWLNRLAGALGKIGTDLAISSRGEIGEMRAGASGGSSTMPHKSNPVTAEALQSLAVLARTFHTGLMSAAVHAEERDGVMWPVEWAFFPALFEVAGASLANTTTLMATLTVNATAMQARIDDNPGVMAEAAVFALSTSLGVVEAKRIVGEALSADEPFLQAVAARSSFNWSAWDPNAASVAAAQSVSEQIFAARNRS